MKQLFSSFCSILAALLVVVSANAQITTSSMNGVVTDENGEALIGASVVAVHTPSGSKYYAATNAEGRYAIQGMRPGGPYEVTISLIGSQTVQYPDITLELGEANTVNAKLALATEELAEVLVVASTSKFATEKTGAAMNINSKKINSVPTVNRSISDIARLSPYASGMSFAGGDGRSTNFTIDGANFNNNFGLSDALPGGGNPISMDALEEVQVVIAPFDVRQTNFIGGGINAITKSGTNDLKVSAYTYYQDQNLRGNRVNGQDQGARADASKKVWGFSIGGPIIKNKLFFFANYEKTLNPGQVIKYRARQDGETPGGNVSRTLASDMQNVQDYVLKKYGYETGSYTNFAGDESNKKFLARIDWNIATGHKLSVRYNDTKNVAWNAPNGNSSDTGYRLNGTYRVGSQSMAFANNMYSMENKVRTWSVDLNDRFSDKVSNQFLFTYSKIDDVRGTNSSAFPHVDIMYQDEDGNYKMEPYMSLGYELFTWNNGVHNKIFTFKDDVTILLGNHKITAGLSLERQLANNAYMRNGAMYYRYRSLDEFLNAAMPESFAITYGWNGNKSPNAQVAFKQYAFYVQDEWNINSKLKLTYGVRFDDLVFDDDDIATNNAILAYSFRNGEKIDTGLWPKNRIQISPRIGFVWDIKGDKSMKLRGGTGFFQGRLPLVYFTNMSTNSGMVQNSVQFKTTYNNGVPTGAYDQRLENFIGGMMTNIDDAIEKLGLPTEITEDKHVAGATMSGVDRNFKMPQVWKTSVAFDYQLPTSFPFSATAELMYQKTIYGVKVDNINISDDTSSWQRFRGADNRLIYPAGNGAINSGKNAPVLTNTSKGWGYTANITLNMTPAKNLDIMAAYTHTESKEVSGLPGSDPLSTWQGMITVDGPNFGTAQRSQYVVPDKVIASLNYTIPFKFEGLTDEMQFNLFYTGYSPYGNSYCYTNDMNGDGINNDLMYIPKDETEINFVSQADADAFWKYVDQDKYLKNHKGEYAEAYAARAPWVHRFDLQWLQNFRFNIGQTTHTIQLSVNVMNIGNMLNSSWGIAKTGSVCSNSTRILKYEGKDENNVPKFSMWKDSNGNYPTQSYDYNYNYDQCWKLQFGVRYIF